MIKKYKKKPVIVEAIQFVNTDERINLIKKFVGESFISKQGWDTLNLKTVRNYYIKTLEGDMNVSQGDFIIKGINGEFYPCKSDIFLKTYEEI